MRRRWAFTRFIYEFTNQHSYVYRLQDLFPSECLDLVPLQLGSSHVIPHVNQSQPKLTPCTRSLRCNTMRCDALHCTASQQQQRSSRESHTYTHTCITHEPKSAAMRSTRIPRHRTPNPTTKPNQRTACHKRQARKQILVTAYPASQPASQATTAHAV
jgi:hypothetical protein